MSETSPYINTFALITFEFENPKDSVKYEYYLENFGSVSETDQTDNVFEITPTNTNEIDNDEESYSQIWIVQELQDDETYQFKIITAERSEDVEHQYKIWIGPFEDKIIAKLTLDALPIQD